MKKLLLGLFFLSVPAYSQTVSAPPGGYKMLYANGTSVGNGADTTYDVLQTFTMAAGQLANVGDTIHIISSGQWAATTDTRNTMFTFGGSSIGGMGNSSSGVTRWSAEIWVTKTGSGTQSFMTLGSVNGSSANNGNTSSTLTISDTSPITIQVLGQNATNPTAGSVTAQGLIVEYLHK